MKHKLSHILEVTLRTINITPEAWEERRKSRDGRIVRAKQLLTFIAIKEGYSCNEVATFLEQHRTTAIHHLSTMQRECQLYPRLQDIVDKIIESLGPIPNRQTMMVMYGWMARSESGFLTVSPTKPEPMGGYWLAEGTRPFPRDQFKQITYETGPVKVKIKVTIEDYETM